MVPGLAQKQLDSICQMNADWRVWGKMEAEVDACSPLSSPSFTQLEGLSHMEQKIPGLRL